ncbi:hypothetical protein [Burkholderia ambifaria]|uniref:Uncharacterized protein n=1 Tax=Burkholderia ambifaria TaxID=152480 RepID=A0AA41JJZ8_9BURK|nr:hypothetical protein [Burkholderia ambifaria]MBR8129817.1 hypothetical protein [Burkholderia ambifaria]UEP50821.1 hypothetical protein LMA00_27940 [Burkholderia ambifaria]
MEFDIERVKILPVDQLLPDHLLERDIVEHIGVDHALAERGKARLDAKGTR